MNTIKILLNRVASLLKRRNITNAKNSIQPQIQDITPKKLTFLEGQLHLLELVNKTEFDPLMTVEEAIKLALDE